jgi:CRISPR-associated protein Csm5
MINIKAYILSPINIGTGNDIDPFSYVLEREEHKTETGTRQGGIFYRYGFKKLLSLLGEDDFKKIKILAEKPSVLNFLEVRKMVGGLINRYPDAVIKRDEIPDTGFIDKYFEERGRSGLNANREINELSVRETFRDGVNPVIPGSSLKGAMRTAILQKAGCFDRIQINEDPFKCMTVSDVVAAEAKISLGYYLNYPINDIRVQPIGLSQAAEVLRQMQTAGTFTIGSRLGNIRSELGDLIKECLSDKSALFETVNGHYLELLKEELEIFRKGSPDNSFVKRADKNRILERCGKKEIAVLKVGFHSGALGVTFKPPHRKISVKTKNGREERERPTTMWHFSLKSGKNVKATELEPSGWLLLI